MSDLLSIINPATEALIKEVPTDDHNTIEAKVHQARQAQPAWANTPWAERAACLKRFRDLLGEAGDRIARTLASETGKPITQGLEEVEETLDHIDVIIAATEPLLAPQQVYTEPVQALLTQASLAEIISQEPLGVIVNLATWNFPICLGIDVVVPALLTGNAVLYKASEVAILTGQIITELMHQAGVPEDVFSLVTGAGATAAALMEQEIDGVFFIGSPGTGKKVALAAAPKLIPAILELGGKDPCYVCEDVDVETAAASIAGGSFYNTGQSCSSVERIYVHHSIHDAFVEAYVQQVRSFQLGDPTDPETFIGPLTQKAHLQHLSGQVEDALAKGAKLQCGGQRVDRPGQYFEPTVFSQVNHEMKLMREETFGPVIGIQSVENDAEAIALMNDSDYGLTASCYSPNRKRAIAIFSKVKSGTAFWNCCDCASPRLPWSGRGQSGIGCNLSTYGIQAFLKPRAWLLHSAPQV